MSDREPTYVERERQRLRALLPDWYVWPTLIQHSGKTDWSAMPAGARTAAVTEHSADELVDAVKAWDVNEYITRIEADLAGTPDDWLHKREMLAANLLAARRLREGQWQAGTAKP